MVWLPHIVGNPLWGTPMALVSDIMSETTLIPRGAGAAVIPSGDAMFSGSTGVLRSW